MTYKKIVLCVIFIFSFIFNLFSQDLLNYSNSLKYANYLFQNKQYQFSAIEYERVTFLAPNDSLAKLRLIQSYRLMQDFNSAKAKLDLFFPESLTFCPENFAVENFRILFHTQQYLNAFRFLEENKTINQLTKIEFELGALLMQYEWTKAKTLAENHLYFDQKSPKYKDLYNITLKGLEIKYKKPYVAAIFSSIVPGSGKIYTKHWKDAIFSFLFVSATSWLTYKSINDNGLDFKSVAYGSIAVCFYSANIYGSYKSAGKYNQKINQNVTKDIESILFDY
jgi:hypothetical protein